MNTFLGRGPKILTLIFIGIAAALGLAACGGSNDSNATAASPPASSDTVAVSDIGSAGQVLVDSQGNALYTPEQEANGKIMCTGSCLSEWMPLTVSGSTQPTASADVTGKLGTVKRPDGGEQVTLNGAPLYTFVEDGGPGNVTGDGFVDQFDGTSFTWHVETASGPSTGGGASQSSTTGSSGGYSY
jgi:predicted lipoprotein with Yx(FWY)xxD motif